MLRAASGDDGAAQQQLLCEYAGFGPFAGSRFKSLPILVAPGDGMACGHLESAASDAQAAVSASGKKLAAFAVVAKRGICTLSHKAQWAMAAGARALIVGHSESGKRPVRMRSAGNEAELVTIPAVMVSAEDAESLIQSADTGTVQLGNSINKDHVYRRELELKNKVFSPRSKKEQLEKAENLMRLGEYFAQGNWTDEATVFLTQAANAAHATDNFEVRTK